MNEKQIEEILDKASTDEPLTDYGKGVMDGYFDGIHVGHGREYNLGFANGIKKLEQDMEEKCQQ